MVAMKNTMPPRRPFEPATVLASDIGGTHSRFALFRITAPEGGTARCTVRLLRRVTFRTAEHRNTRELFSRLFEDGADPALLSRNEAGPAAATLAIPAATKGRDPFTEPDREECCPCANIGWPICWQEAHAVLGITNIHMINDFTAQGFACAALPESLDAGEIRPGQADRESPLALVGAGTGLGQCLIVPGPDPVVFPSEGGHGIFPFEGEEEFRFVRFLREQFPKKRPIKDFIMSGAGLAALFAYHTGETLPVEDVPPRLAVREGATAIVLEWYARFYGRVCREYALNTLPRHGIFISGGMAARIPGLFDHPAFEAELYNSPIMRSAMGNLPVAHVRSQLAGLWGAAAFAALSLFGPVTLTMAEE